MALATRQCWGVGVTEQAGHGLPGFLVPQFRLFSAFLPLALVLFELTGCTFPHIPSLVSAVKITKGKKGNSMTGPHK